MAPRTRSDPTPWRSARQGTVAGRSTAAGRAVVVAIYAACALAIVVGVGLAVPGITTATAGLRYPVTADDAASARVALDALEVKGRAPRTGYDRAQFGQAWQDVDHNGCDTRNDVLARDLTDVTFKVGTGDCLVLSGLLADPYSGRELTFQRGPETSADVQIDHVVALAEAWQKGAQGWTPQVREAFANDPANLLAVDGPLNQEKGAGDAATWLPPHKPFRCRYVIRQIRVKAAYGLWVTAAERDALGRELGRCELAPAPDG